MKKICTLLLASFSCLFALEFNEEINNIVSNNPEVKAKLSYYKAVKEDVQIAKSSYKPSIDVTGTYGKEKLEYDRSINNTNETSHSATVSIKQNLFNGFYTQSTVEQNEARLSSAAYSFLDTLNITSLASIQAYLEVLKQKELTELFKENVRNHEDIYSKIEERTNAGRGRKSEVQQTESRLQLAYSNLVVQQNNYQDTLTNYNYYAGKYFDFDTAQKPKFTFELPKNLDDTLHLALANNYAIKALQSNMEAKKSEYESTKSNFYPKIDAIASKDWTNNVDGVDGKKDTAKAYLMFSYNLYNGGRDEAQQAKKLHEVQEETNNLQKIKRDILKTARLSYVAYEMYKKQLEYLALHVKAAKDTLESYKEEYNLGRRDLLAILDAQKEYITARQTYLKAEYDFLYSKFRILEAISQLPVKLHLSNLDKVDSTLIQDKLADTTRYPKNSLCDNDTNDQNCQNIPVINIGYLQDK